MSKVHARSHEITNKPLRVRHYEFVLQKHYDYRLEKQASVPQMLKKMNRRKQNFEG